MSDRLNLALRSVSDSASKPSDAANDAKLMKTARAVGKSLAS